MLFADLFDVTLSDISIFSFRLTNASQFKGIFIEDACLVPIFVSKVGAKSLSKKNIRIEWHNSTKLKPLTAFLNVAAFSFAAFKSWATLYDFDRFDLC